MVAAAGTTAPIGRQPTRSTGKQPRIANGDDLVSLYREAELFEALCDRERLDGKCGICEFRYVCGGSRSRAYAASGDPLGSDPLCAYVPDGYEGLLPWDDAESRG
jgi:hypothetical protein